jgi:hypothetical protein
MCGRFLLRKVDEVLAEMLAVTGRRETDPSVRRRYLVQCLQ